MPNYQYKCKECEHVFDVIHSINEDKDGLGLVCENCGSENIFKYLGGYGTATIIFKGTGWVINDTALEKVGMPKPQRESREAQEKLKDM